MVFIKNFVIFYSILFYLSQDIVNCKLPNSNVAGKSNNEKILIDHLTPKLDQSKTKLPSEGRSTYFKPDPYYNRDIYDYSPGFDSFYNNINNYPQSSVSYYPFSLQNVDYLYPKVFNRFYPYTSNIMQKSFQSPSDFPAQDNQIPFYRDAQYYEDEPDSEFQVIKRLVPIGYSTHVVSPRAAVSTADKIIDQNGLQDPIPIVPYPNIVPLRLAADDNVDMLLKAMKKAVEEASLNNSTVPETSNTIREKVETIARLMLLVPSFADEMYKCVAESKAASKFIQTAQSFSGRSVEVID